MHDAHGFQSMDEAGIDQANASQDYKKCQKLAPVHISQHASTWSNRMCRLLAQWRLTARSACVAERHSSAHINCMHACAEAAQTARHAAKTAIQHKLHIIASRVRSTTLFFKACFPSPLRFSKKTSQRPSLPGAALGLHAFKLRASSTPCSTLSSTSAWHDNMAYLSNGKVKSTQAARAYVRPASHLHCRATAPSAPPARSAAAGTAAPSPYRA